LNYLFWQTRLAINVLAFVGRVGHNQRFGESAIAERSLCSRGCCEGVQPAVAASARDFHLAIVVIVVMVVIFAVVLGMVVNALLRFPRWREGERDPEQREGNKTIEIVWTAIPLVIVTALFDQQSPPRDAAWLRDSQGRQRDDAQHGSKHWHRRERPDLAETAGNIVGRQHHQVPGDMGGEQPAECQETNDINRACCRAQASR
jgi:Cytochrome C oxidase subunit II, transmembrane domain